MPIRLTQRAQADDLLTRSPLALLIGMLLDQQIPMEWAFSGPLTIAERLGRDHNAGSDDGSDSGGGVPAAEGGGTAAPPALDAREIAEYDPEAFAALLARKPAVHRYPRAMAARVQRLAAYLVEHYDGSAEAVWADAHDGAELLRRVMALPGFGRQKAEIFVALLGKQLGVRPPGWRQAAGPYGREGVHRSVADVVDADSLARVRQTKQAAKKAARR